MTMSRFGCDFVRGFVRGLLVLSLVAWLGASALAEPINQIVAFGDSLSDTGNDFIGSGGTSPAPPYYDGRFSNGPNWIDDLASKLGVTDPAPSLAGGTNYAYGGATASSIYLGVPDLAQQVQQYLTNSPTANPHALYTVLAGANDFFGGVTDPSVPANAVNAALTTLIGAGAKNILVSDLPPQGITPLIQSEGPAAVAAIDNLDVAFNNDLSADVAGLRAANPGVTISVLDLYSLTNTILQDPAAYGFINTTDEGINAPPGANLNQYLFWDDVHPTAAAHQLIADAAFAAAPEPSTFMLASLSIIGVALCLLRRRGLIAEKR
jgi:phospholipase/lecithinase/hemolysin